MIREAMEDSRVARRTSVWRRGRAASMKAAAENGERIDRVAW